jgi:zinc D-Ala-D-Ala carboxypeptidase
MILSPHFSLAEFEFSQTATRHGINNRATGDAIRNLRRLCVTVLEPLRAAIGRPIRVTSGYRSPELNRRVGGAENSAHMRGLAADIVVSGMSSRELCRSIVLLNLPFDQLIDEFSAWSHVAIAQEHQQPRREQLTAVRAADGSPAYRRGIA